MSRLCKSPLLLQAAFVSRLCKPPLQAVSTSGLYQEPPLRVAFMSCLCLLPVAFMSALANYFPWLELVRVAIFAERIYSCFVVGSCRGRFGTKRRPIADPQSPGRKQIRTMAMAQVWMRPLRHPSLSWWQQRLPSSRWKSCLCDFVFLSAGNDCIFGLTSHKKCCYYFRFLQWVAYYSRSWQRTEGEDVEKNTLLLPCEMYCGILWRSCRHARTINLQFIV